MSNQTNDRLLGSAQETNPARLLDEEEVERLIAEREEQAKKDEESK